MSTPSSPSNYFWKKTNNRTAPRSLLYHRPRILGQPNRCPRQGPRHAARTVIYSTLYIPPQTTIHNYHHHHYHHTPKPGLFPFLSISVISLYKYSNILMLNTFVGSTVQWGEEGERERERQRGRIWISEVQTRKSDSDVQYSAGRGGALWESFWRAAEFGCCAFFFIPKLDS